jgi:hypothetical protein
LVAVSLGLLGAPSASAQSNELNRFDDEESYPVAGQTILFHRVPDEIVVRFTSTNPPLVALEDWKSVSGHELDGVKEVHGGALLCRSTTTNDAAAILDALRNDAQVRYAFPAYRGVTTGNRVFLIDEVVVSYRISDLAVRTECGLTYASGNSSFTVYRLLNPNRVNPFKLCAVLRTLVTWAEPNKSQELSFWPNDPVTPVDSTMQTNSVAFPPLSAFTNSSPLMLIRPAFTSLSRSNGGLVVEWFGPGTLQSADDPNGPWTDLSNATSPHVAPLSGRAGFFRLRVGPTTP